MVIKIVAGPANSPIGDECGGGSKNSTTTSKREIQAKASMNEALSSQCQTLVAKVP